MFIAQRLRRLVALASLLGGLPGAAAAAPPVIDVWYGDTQAFGQVGEPQVWANVLGTVSDPDNAVVSLSYRLNGGAVRNLSIGPNTRRLLEPGDFNVEIAFAELLAGANSVVLTAIDAAAQVTQRTVTLDYTPGNSWPRTTTSSWSPSTPLEDVAQVVDGRWSASASGLRSDVMGYDRVIAIGDVDWTDYEITVPITLHAIDPAGFFYPSVAPGIGITARWLGHTELTSGEQPHQYWLPSGGTLWYDYGNDRIALGGTPGLSLTNPTMLPFGVPYVWKLRVETLPNGESLYSAKVWPQGQPEPGTWLMSGTKPVSDLTNGSMLLVAHHVDATFGDVQVVDLANPALPAVVTKVGATPGSDEASVRLVTSKPCIVTVEYGLDTSYGSSVVESVPTTVHEIPLFGLAPETTYHFRVHADDGDGHVSSSTDQTFTTGAPIVSDDFSGGALDPGVWTFVNPLGDATAALNGTQLEISVPANGAEHSIWVGADTLPRVMQGVPNGDFQIEAKFESSLTQNVQIQGILIEQDPANVIRIEFHRVSGSGRFFAATIGATAKIKFNQAVSPNAPMWIRVTRSGDDWTIDRSFDGQAWVTAGSFTHAMVVGSAGVYAGNDADTAHTAIVDYFFDTEHPILDEDGGGYPVAVNVVGQGSVTRTPDLTAYTQGALVELEAFPASPDWIFQGWSGALMGSANPASLQVDGPENVTATFVQVGDSTPPVLSGIAVSTTDTTATVTWTTDEPADSLVEYGLAAGSYGAGEGAPAAVTSHSVELTSLAPATEYHFRVSSEDPSGNAAFSGDLVFQTLEAGQTGGIVSDDFSGSGIDLSVWSFVNPLGDATAAQNGTQLVIDVPGNGLDHSIWGGVDTLPRLVQPVPDEDFEIEAKFESNVTVDGQIQGILVEQGPDNALRFEFHQVGTSRRVFAAAIIGGVGSVKLLKNVPIAPPMWLRVTRTGNSWTLTHSFDGTNWEFDTTFSQPLAVTRAGVFGGNGVAGAHTALVDYFFDTSAPIEPEDPAGLVLDVGVSGGGSVQVDPDLPFYALGQAVELTAVPNSSSWAFSGWTGDVTSAANPLALVMDAHTSLTANFTALEDDQAPAISAISVTSTETSATVSWTTDEPATSEVRFGTGPALGALATSGGLNTAHSVVLAPLATATEYHFQVTSADASLNAASAGGFVFKTKDPLQNGAVISDDFHGSGLDRALWEFIDPLGDANLALTGTALEIAVPGNAINHGIWTNGNFAPRAMQAIPNVDFQVVAKFESDVSVHEQIQGILVEQDPGNVIRFEIHHFGSIDRIFSATIFGTTASIKLLASIGASAPMWLRVTRTGNDFLYEYSFDGTSYGFGASFSAPMTVNKVGVFAGNTPGTPHTMRLDYFFNTATPIEPEDGGDHTVNVAVNGGGSVMRSPAGPTYETGTTLQLDALPTLPDWVFDGWTGDITTASNPLVFDVTSDVELTANFLQVQDTTPPLISALAVSPGETSATVTWVTDEPASSAVDYGPTAAYTGSASDPAPKTAHALVLGGLAPDTEYHFEVLSEDPDGNLAATGDLVFRTLASGASGVRSDTFDGSGLDLGLWSFVNPLGDAAVAVTGGRLEIAVPGGALDHDYSTSGDTLPRVMQAVPDADFSVQAKFDSAVAADDQAHGFLVEAAPGDALRVELHRAAGATRLFATRVNGASAATHLLEDVVGSPPAWLRLVRIGDEFTLSHSQDGTLWSSAGSFSAPLAVASLGVFAGNSAGTPYTALVDSFLDVSGGAPAPDPQCSDGLDNDGDTVLDGADPGCRNASWDSEVAGCDDQIDNNGDTLVDLADPVCRNGWSDNELSRCGLLGIEVLPVLGWAASRRRRRRRAAQEGAPGAQSEGVAQDPAGC